MPDRPPAGSCGRSFSAASGNVCPVSGCCPILASGWVGERLPCWGRAAAGQDPSSHRVWRSRWRVRRGSRRDWPAPGRCRPARRCVITSGTLVGGPPPRAAMLRAPTTSRWPVCPQAGHAKRLPAGLGTLVWQAGQLEEVPRSSTMTTRRPATTALSVSRVMLCPTRQARVRWLWRRPASRSRTPRGSPTARISTRWVAAQFTTARAASCWACARRRRWRASRRRLRARNLRHRRDPRCPGLGARAAAARLRALDSARCRRLSARNARPDTSSPPRLSGQATA
jgi:hypothetical protein